MTDQPPAADAPKREVLTIYVAEDEDGIHVVRERDEEEVTYGDSTWRERVRAASAART
mgnify:CR=1 FL=1